MTGNSCLNEGRGGYQNSKCSSLRFIQPFCMNSKINPLQKGKRSEMRGEGVSWIDKMCRQQSEVWGGCGINNRYITHQRRTPGTHCTRIHNATSLLLQRHKCHQFFWGRTNSGSLLKTYRSSLESHSHLTAVGTIVCLQRNH